jgi:hypothetical protein
MHVKAERNERFREEFEKLMFLYLRLAEQADQKEPSKVAAQRQSLGFSKGYRLR